MSKAGHRRPRVNAMQLLNVVLDAHTDLPEADRTWLRALIREWHLLADTSFSDLILWVADRDDNVFWAAAQVRPSTGPTALEDDVVGEEIAYDPESQVTGAYLSRQILSTSDNKLQSGIPVAVTAIPVIRHDAVIAVVELHANQMGVRVCGGLEDTYLEVAAALSDMLWNGEFPLDPQSEASASPKVGDGLFRVDRDGIVSYASPNAVSAYRRLGLVGDLVGENLTEISAALAPVEVLARSSDAVNGEQQLVELRLDRPDASVRLRVIPLRLAGEPAGFVCLCADVTALRNRERELVTKDATIREIHHRVKNNLQTVAALLRLQSRRMHTEEAKLALKNAMARVQSIAVVHELLSQTYDEQVEFDDVADRILDMVGDVASTTGEVQARREGSFGLVPARVATSLSLIITELCQNAIEHGLSSSSGSVVVRPWVDDEMMTVAVIDDGKGLPDGFELLNTNSLGLSIVSTLVADLDGRFDVFDNPQGHGTTARIVLPLLNMQP